MDAKNEIKDIKPHHPQRQDQSLYQRPRGRESRTYRLEGKFMEKQARKWTIISGFSLGLLLEIFQGSLLSYRSFEVYDLLANTLGIVFFLFLSKRVKKLLSNAVFL